jgi:pantoate--beta-alanine ligase
VAELVSTVAELRTRLAALRREGSSASLVPTMGALHAGHRRLLEIARHETDTVVASIFVNPTQFDRPEDLERYPRPMAEDMALCAESGVDFVFAPSAAEMYPQEQLAWVEVPSLTRYLCGPGRPGHFRGVATVVMKLLQMVQPERAYFGEKDAQQLAIIRRLVADLNVPTIIVPVATVREADGLALSSRNRHLSKDERAQAVVLSQALFAARDAVLRGEMSAKAIEAAAAPLFRDVQLEYFSVVDPDTLAPVEHITGRVLVAGAIWVGSTRLIDNLTA